MKPFVFDREPTDQEREIFIIWCKALDRSICI